MIYLILAILLNVLMLVIFKLIGILKLNVEQAVAFNYFFAAITGFLMLPHGVAIIDIVGKKWFFYAIFVASVFVVNFYIFAASSKKEGVALTSVFSKMSVIIPVVAGFLIFKDSVSLLKISGILLGLFSFYLILKPEKKIYIDKVHIFLPFLLMLGAGTNDTIIKYVQYNFLNGDESLFIDAVFSVSFIVSLLILLWRIFVKKVNIDIKSVLMGLILGAVNFFGAWNFLQSMSYFQASVLFPLVNVSIVILTTLVGIIIFKEKFSKVNLTGLLIAIVAIVMISLG